MNDVPTPNVWYLWHLTSDMPSSSLLPPYTWTVTHMTHVTLWRPPPRQTRSRMREGNMETVSTRSSCLSFLPDIDDVFLLCNTWLQCVPAMESVSQAASESERERWDFKFFPNFTSFVMLEIIMKTSSGLGTSIHSHSLGVAASEL